MVERGVVREAEQLENDAVGVGEVAARLRSRKTPAPNLVRNSYLVPYRIAKRTTV